MILSKKEFGLFDWDRTRASKQRKKIRLKKSFWKSWERGETKLKEVVFLRMMICRSAACMRGEVDTCWDLCQCASWPTCDFSFCTRKCFCKYLTILYGFHEYKCSVTQASTNAQGNHHSTIAIYHACYLTRKDWSSHLLKYLTLDYVWYALMCFKFFVEILLFLVNKQPRTLDKIKSNRQLLKRIRKVNMIKLTKEEV